MKTLHEQILATLEAVDRPGNYCASGTVPLVLPGLEVAGLGPVALPLTGIAAKELIACCHQAPYGKGTETVVDTKVRKVWELDPGQFELLNPEWPGCVERITDAVREHLGLKEQTLDAQLYKLLIYEKGGFFLPHKDGEKVDRMVATLVVGLPSKHAGGELLVRHAGAESVIRFDDPTQQYAVQYAAFYADCEHEVKPLESGYRLCLVYNLVLSGTDQEKLQAPNFAEQTSQLTALLQKWKASKQTEKLAFGLSYEYSKDGLSPENLKGEDRTLAEVITSAAEKAGCRATIGLLTLWECGSGSSDRDDEYDRYSRYDDHENDDGDGVYTMLDVDDFSLTASDWVGLDGTRPSFGKLSFEEKEIVSQQPIKQTTPEEEFEGYTGNAGMTLQRWYRQAVVAIWPNESHYRVICNAGTGPSVSELCRMADQISGLSGDEKRQHRIECRSFGVAILSKWRSGYADIIGAKRVSAADLILKALSRIGSRGLVQRFLQRIAPTEPLLTDMRRLSRLCGRFGWSACDAGLTAIFEQKEPRRLNRNATLLHALCRHPDKDKAKIAICEKLTDMMLQAVFTWAMQIKFDHWDDRNVKAADLMLHLIKSQCWLDDKVRTAKTIQLVQPLKEKFDPVAVQIPVARQLMSFLTTHRLKNTHPIENWLSSLQALLEERTAEEPQAPADFVREAVLLCTCANCKSVNNFLTRPDEQKFPLRARQDLRNHVEANIRQYRADLSTMTIRQGSPQTLLCTKTTASWEFRHETWRHDCESLTIIRKILTFLKAAPATSETKKSGTAKISAKNTNPS
ncbi:MAG TPA: 2OG-Fe(II) oxygenase, partial [Planctomycetaceae bacterium]|nr:2OG-Fe(II) oxygenase [Planctomycetaceae bacterium]